MRTKRGLMSNPERFPFIGTEQIPGEAGLQPLLPIVLTHNDVSVSSHGLLDTGSMVNVLPYSIGEQLGAQWENRSTSVRLTGNLANYDARAIIVLVHVGSFEPARMVFAWTQADNVPLLLGQVNFFMEFDVCFYRSQLTFEVQPKATDVNQA